MKCPNCKVENKLSNKFCENCGSKLEIDKEHSITKDISTVKEQKNNNSSNDSNTYLIIGIVMTVLCSPMFGVGIIILNEMKYRKELSNNNLIEAEKTKKIMLVLTIVGVVLGIIGSILTLVLNYVVQ